MSHVLPQPATLVAEPEALINRLSENLEQTISFAEECRWRFPELSTDAEQLAAAALALFSKTLRSLHGEAPQAREAAVVDDLPAPWRSSADAATIAI